MKKKLSVNIIGSTGAVGLEILRVIEERCFPVGDLRLFASRRSVGKKQIFCKKDYTVEELSSESLQKSKADFCFFSIDSDSTRTYVPVALETGSIVVDNSSAYRMEENIPLVIPEINPEALHNHKGLIANPNCSTIIMLMAIAPIHRINPIEEIVVSTYQAVSGAGMAAMEELKSQTRSFLEGDEVQPKIFSHPIAFNAFSHDSEVEMASGYNKEEIKMIQETHKILQDTSIRIAPTCIRVSTLRAHGESIHLKLKEDIDLSAIQKALKTFPGVKLVDDRGMNVFPTPIESSHKDEVFVGRLRSSFKRDSEKSRRELQLWCCGDQLLKGAALNAVQIAEKLIDDF